MGLRLVFVTPAWKRFDLSRVCFAQRAWMLAELRERCGIDGQAVVIADDENLAIAEEFGFATIERDNAGLGRRWNDGYEHAAAEGADFVVPVGSDTWLHPSLFATLTKGQEWVTAARRYALLNRTGSELSELDLGRRRGSVKPPARFAVSVWALPLQLLEPTGFRPCAEEIMSGCDGSTFRRVEEAGRTLAFEYRRAHALDIVAFRSDIQITPYERLTRRFSGRVCRQPFARLREHYPAAIVDRARDLYGPARA